ncbi:hypothetical protein N7493_001635 [Penicillium malachiteum]|uniref:Uncharacterized protein n=1 Tax=Penicillium malachiteum TaxID=1324776 RepID=A0AAD6N011_9EURO|nr:hypothetical protein N7493_001635 [Penicillium malachiteum]
MVAPLLHAVYHSPTVECICEEATRILLQRIVDDRDDPDVEAMKSLKSQASLRWLTFFLGVLPQLIKLFASRGIPLFQILGAMYLFSWVIFEAIVFATDMKYIEPQITLRPHRRGRPTRVLVSWTAKLAILSSTMIFSLPAWSVYLTFRPLLAGLLESSSLGFFVSYILYPSGLLFFHLPLWSEFLWGADVDDRSPYDNFFVFLGVSSQSLFPLVAMGVPGFDFLKRWEVLVTVVLTLATSIGYGSCMCGAKTGRFGVVALIWKVLCMIPLSIFYFGCLYNPKDTEIPSWTLVLG